MYISKAATICFLVSLTTVLASAGSASAEITVWKCIISNVGQIYFTWYSDGTPARVGVQPGLGNKASLAREPSGLLVFVETNGVGTPITLTTIQPNGKTFHSRHAAAVDGAVIAPSQGSGNCERVSF